MCKQLHTICIDIAIIIVIFTYVIFYTHVYIGGFSVISRVLYIRGRWVGGGGRVSGPWEP